jgi:GNAT superfamily N-acetyltransferase
LDTFLIRRLDARDSMEDLTSMLHRAFSPMGRRGIGCTCFNQSVEVTAERAGLGDCFVATQHGRIVGTLTLHDPDKRSECHWYRQADIASLHQFAVDPAYQGTGCGLALLEFAMQWAHQHHFHGLALDTPLPASDLIHFYEAHGFRKVERVRFHGKGYTSCVLSKTVRDATTHRDSNSELTQQNRLRKPLFGALV